MATEVRARQLALVALDSKKEAPARLATVYDIPMACSLASANLIALSGYPGEAQ